LVRWLSISSLRPTTLCHPDSNCCQPRSQSKKHAARYFLTANITSFFASINADEAAVNVRIGGDTLTGGRAGERFDEFELRARKSE
jgi:hypothetical protein